MGAEKNDKPTFDFQDSLAPAGPIQIDYRDEKTDELAQTNHGSWQSWRPLASIRPLTSLQPLANTIAPERRSPENGRKTLGLRVLFAVAVGTLALTGLGLSCASSADTSTSTTEAKIVRRVGAPSLKQSPLGTHVRWQKQSITVMIDPSVDKLAHGGSEGVVDAIDTWMTNADIPEVQVDRSSKPGKAERDGVNRIIAAPIAMPGHEDDLALTITYVSEDTGELVEADMILNTRYPWGLVEPPTASMKVDPDQRASHGKEQKPMERHLASCGHRFDVQNVVTHELGHFFGLGEDTSDTEATMYYKSARCETKKRTLSADDIAVVDELYHESQDEPGVSCSTAPRPKGAASGWAWLVTLFGLGLLRHRR